MEYLLFFFSRQHSDLHLSWFNNVLACWVVHILSVHINFLWRKRFTSYMLQKMRQTALIVKSNPFRCVEWLKLGQSLKETQYKVYLLLIQAFYIWFTSMLLSLPGYEAARKQLSTSLSQLYIMSQATQRYIPLEMGP